MIKRWKNTMLANMDIENIIRGRYNLPSGWEEAQDGPWCKYSDVAALESQLIQLRAENERMKASGEQITDVKVVNELLVEMQRDDISEDERLMSLSVLECKSCHWVFFGEAQRGYPYYAVDEGTDTPNYCPMCGKKIDGYEDFQIKDALAGLEG